MHWINWVIVGALVLMPVLFVLTTRKVVAQRRRQNDLLERIATALENRKP
jgi:hypothetical protein